MTINMPENAMSRHAGSKHGIVISNRTVLSLRIAAIIHSFLFAVLQSKFTTVVVVTGLRILIFTWNFQISDPYSNSFQI